MANDNHIDAVYDAWGAAKPEPGELTAKLNPNVTHIGRLPDGSIHGYVINNRYIPLQVEPEAVDGLPKD